MDESFPIPKDGIVGQQFLFTNKAVINIANNKLTLNKKPDNKEKNNKFNYTLEPRSETIIKIPIADKTVENKNILVYKLEIIN